ncbi:MAG: NAD(P)H-hydrate dehydratase [Calditrichaeota bacterium]|nr:MAG: NAD(P)H-hydrate dehydratase [Calditrichota bacterium]
MIVLSGEQMREADRRAIEGLGIPGLILMENAGRAVADYALSMLESVPDPLVAVFAGKGNNAGDGFVAARHLANWGAEVVIFLIGDPAKLAGDARVNFDICQRLNIPVQVIASEQDLESIPLDEFDLVVDALLGTGLTGPPRGLVKAAIQQINEMEAKILAVDLPSGLMAGSPAVPGEAVLADLTVTMAAPKICHLFYPARQHVGELETVDIGIPGEVLESVGSQVFLVEPWQLVLPFRPPDAHKYQMGRVAIVAGSRGYTGAAALCAQAVMKAGAGIAILAVPESLNPILEVKLTEVITRPVAETADGGFSRQALPELAALLEWCDVLAIGPGLGRHPETQSVVVELLARCDKPAVVDADALFALSEKAKGLKELLKPNWVLTPHLGEFARFFKQQRTETLNLKRLDFARDFAREYQTHLLLKGAPALVAAPEGKIQVNPLINPALATAGTGDVLTGMIAAFAAQGLPMGDAAVLANYLHGYVAEWLKGQQTAHTITAPDLLEGMGPAFLEFEKETRQRIARILGRTEMD